MQYLARMARAQLEKQRVSVGTHDEQEKLEAALEKLSRFTNSPPQQAARFVSEKVGGRFGEVLRILAAIAALASLWAWAVFQFY